MLSPLCWRSAAKKGPTDKDMRGVDDLAGALCLRGNLWADVFRQLPINMNAGLMVFEMSHLRDKKRMQAASMVLLIFLSTQMMYNSPEKSQSAS